MSKKRKVHARPVAKVTTKKIGWHHAGPRLADWEYSNLPDDHGGLAECEIHQMQGR